MKMGQDISSQNTVKLATTMPPEIATQFKQTHILSTDFMTCPSSIGHLNSDPLIQIPQQVFTNKDIAKDTVSLNKITQKTTNSLQSTEIQENQKESDIEEEYLYLTRQSNHIFTNKRNQTRMNYRVSQYLKNKKSKRIHLLLKDDLPQIDKYKLNERNSQDGKYLLSQTNFDINQTGHPKPQGDEKVMGSGGDQSNEIYRIQNEDTQVGIPQMETTSILDDPNSIEDLSTFSEGKNNISNFKKIDCIDQYQTHPISLSNNQRIKQLQSDNIPSAILPQQIQTIIDKFQTPSLTQSQQNEEQIINNTLKIQHDSPQKADNLYDQYNSASSLYGEGNLLSNLNSSLQNYNINTKNQGLCSEQIHLNTFPLLNQIEPSFSNQNQNISIKECSGEYTKATLGQISSSQRIHSIQFMDNFTKPKSNLNISEHFKLNNQKISINSINTQSNVINSQPEQISEGINRNYELINSLPKLSLDFSNHQANPQFSFSKQLYDPTMPNELSNERKQQEYFQKYYGPELGQQIQQKYSKTQQIDNKEQRKYDDICGQDNNNQSITLTHVTEKEEITNRNLERQQIIEHTSFLTFNPLKQTYLDDKNSQVLSGYDFQYQSNSKCSFETPKYHSQSTQTDNIEDHQISSDIIYGKVGESTKIHTDVPNYQSQIIDSHSNYKIVEHLSKSLQIEQKKEFSTLQSTERPKKEKQSIQLLSDFPKRFDWTQPTFPLRISNEDIIRLREHLKGNGIQFKQHENISTFQISIEELKLIGKNRLSKQITEPDYLCSENNKQKSIDICKADQIQRLVLGTKRKVPQKEMFALTKKNYQNLPEVREKQQQIENQIKKNEFLMIRKDKLRELNEVNKLQQIPSFNSSSLKIFFYEYSNELIRKLKVETDNPRIESKKNPICQDLIYYYKQILYLIRITNKSTTILHIIDIAFDVMYIQIGISISLNQSSSKLSQKSTKS